MNTTVTHVFKSPKQAEAALNQLKAEGILEKDISVLMSKDTHGQEFDIQNNSKAPEGIAIGATAGGVMGAIAAGMTAVGTVALTGGAGIVAAGPVVAALAGMGAGAGAGGIIGGLAGLGFNENEAKQTQHDLENGSVLVTVETDSVLRNRVQFILEHAIEDNYEKAHLISPVDSKRTN